MKLPLIPQDKANHFIYGLIIFLLSNIILNNLFSLIIVIVFAITKELYDQVKYEGFDWKDILATIISPLILIGFEILNK